MSTRAYAFIELDRPQQPGTSRFQQLAAETADRGPRLSVARLDDQEVRERSGSDRYVAHAPEIPLQEISPAPEIDPMPAAPAVGAPGDGSSACTWGIQAMAADTCRRSGDGVTVAILDSGIDLDHAAFVQIRDRIVVTDYSGAGDGDASGHGTHCAATICGQDVGGVRIGVARGLSRLLVGRVFDALGRASSLALFRGIQDAITARASVLSMSLGFDFPGMVARLVDEERYPVKLAAARALTDLMANVRLFDTYAQLAERMAQITGGTLLVAAAGNESTEAFRVPVSLPAAAERVISVGAAGPGPQGWTVASFSNTGPTLCGPGVAVLSATAGTADALAFKSGTSMATPHVAGAAALWLEELRERGDFASAPTVAMRLTQACTLGFAPGVAGSERGIGLVRAP